MQSTAARFTIRSLAKRKLMREPVRSYFCCRPVPLAATDATTAIDGRPQARETDSDWVKSAINQILQTYSCSVNGNKDGGNHSLIRDGDASGATQTLKGGVSDEDLNKAVQYFQYRLKEAQLCVSDCKECESIASLAEEVASAEKAIANSVGSLVDLLETIREGAFQQQERLQLIREEAVNAIRDVRADLNDFKRRSL